MSARIVEATALSPSSFRKRHAQLVDTYTKSEPEEASSEAEESQPLGFRVPLMGEEFKASKPSSTRTVSSHSLVSSDSTAPLTLDHPLNHASALSPSSFRKRGGSKDESLDSDDEREGHGLDNEGQGLDDEGPDMKEEEEATPEGQQHRQTQQLCRRSLGNPEPIPRRSVVWELSTKEITPSTYERLDTLPPTLFKGYDRDLRELYTRSGAVRDEIFLQRYRFSSLEREQERATVTFSAI
nr:hypothetical protein [Tanacetum cinerariifolium]